MEPASPAPPPLRPVWLTPAIVAAVGIVVVVLIAVVHRHADRSSASARTTTTSTTVPQTTTTTGVGGSAGSAGNPVPVGETGAIGGWGVTIQSATDSNGAVLASVRLEWQGTGSAGISDATTLSFTVDDSSGSHGQGGAACSGSQDELASVPHLDIGTSDTIAMCWTVPNVDRTSAVLVARSTVAADPIFLALA